MQEQRKGQDGMTEIKIGDDVTVRGKVTAMENGCIKFTTRTGTSLWVMPEDVKTLRPVRKEKA